LAKSYGFTDTGADVSISGSTATYLLLGVQDTPPTDIDLSLATTTVGYNTAALTWGQVKVYSWVTQKGVPGTTTWSSSGTETVFYRARATSANLDVRCRVNRVNASGVVQDTGTWTAYQTTSTQNLTFNPSKPTWGTPALDDRLSIDIEFKDKRTSGTSVSYRFTTNFGDARATPSSYFTTQVEGPEAAAYKKIYYLTNDTSDLSTYANGTYVMNDTGESTTSTFSITSINSSKTFGWITPANTPNNADFDDGTIDMQFRFPFSIENRTETKTINIYPVIDRISSSGTILESTSNVVLAVVDDANSSGDMYAIVRIPNKTWTAGNATDRLGLKITLTISAPTGVFDFKARLHDGTNKIAVLYSKITDNTSSGSTTYKTLTPAATGANSITYSYTAVKSLSSTATGVEALNRLIGITKTVTSTEASNLSRNIGLNLSYNGAGSDSIIKNIGKTLTSSSTGLSSYTLGLLQTLAFTVYSTAMATKSSIFTAVRSFSSAGTGTSSLSRLIGKTIGTTSIGVETVIKTVKKTLTAATGGGVELSRKVGFVRAIAGSVAASAANALLSQLSFMCGGAGVPSLNKSTIFGGPTIWKIVVGFKDLWHDLWK
jgi:hypothetical protein